jgi:uncharacterized coiled-coil DUF342 family protein
MSSLRRQLQKYRMKHVNSLIVRDSLRSEVSKQRAIADDMREKQDQLLIDIAKLTALTTQLESQMVELRKRHEEEIQKRNDRLEFRPLIARFCCDRLFFFNCEIASRSDLDSAAAHVNCFCR